MSRSISRHSVARGFGTILLWGAIVALVAPLIFAIVTALRPSPDVASDPLSFPTRFTLDNVVTVFEKINYGPSVLNTIVILLGSSVLIVMLGALASYPLARISSAWSTWTYRLFIVGTTIPIFVILGPLYLLMRDAHLLGTFPGVMLIYAATNLPVAVFFFTSFIRQIPRELEEAAAMDGAGPFRVFWTIIFPLLRPVVATLATFVSLGIWNDLIVPLVFLPSVERRTIMANAYGILNSLTVQPTELFPAALLGVLPLLTFYVILQRQVVEGIAQGASK